MAREQGLFFEDESIERDRIVSDEKYISQEIFCPICYCLLWKPRSCASCQQLFCNKCIQTWLSTNSTTCPLCRSQYEDKPIPQSIQLKLSRLSIQCRNKSFHCTEIIPYDLLEEHETINCNFLTKKCCICEQIVFFSNFEEHINLCKPFEVQCSLCRHFIKRHLLKYHQNECLQQYLGAYEQLPEELRTSLNYSNETILTTTTTNEVDFIGIETFNQARQKNYLIRLLAMFQLILNNFSIAHFILLNLFAWGCGNLKNTFHKFLFYIQLWIHKSIYQSYIFIFIFSIIFNNTLSFLFELLNDTFIIIFIILSLIIWSSITSNLQIKKFQINFNFQDMLLFYILILFFFEAPLLILRFYLDYISTNIRIICLTLCIILYSKYFSMSRGHYNRFFLID